MTTEDKTSSLLSNQYQGKQRTEALAEEVKEKSETPQEKPSDKKVDWEKRYGDLQSHSDKRDNEYQKEIVTLKQIAKEATPTWTPPSTDEEMEAFKTEHPDVYNMIETIGHKQAEGAINEAKELRKELQETQTANSQREGLVILRSNHPDYFEIYESDEYQAWVEVQPKNIQEWAKDESDGALVSRVLDLYKSDTNKVSKKVKDPKKLEEDASKLVGTQTKGDSKEPKEKESFSRRQIDAMSITEYEVKEEAIMVARQEGRIVDDKR